MKLKWNISITRIWDKSELKNYLEEKIEELKQSDLLLYGKYDLTMSEINKLVSKNSTMESLKSEIEKNNSMLTQLIDHLSNLPSYYYWIGGILTIGLGGAAYYYLKDELILRTLIHLKNGLTKTNMGVNEASEAIRETNESVKFLSGKINEVVVGTNNNIRDIGALSSGLNQLKEHIGIQQAVIGGLPTDQLKDKEIRELLKELLTADNLFALLELSQLLLAMEGQNFEKLQHLIEKVKIEPTGSESRRIIRRGNIVSFN